MRFFTEGLKLVMSHRIKYILSVIIFLLGFIFYMGYMIIWQDGHTKYTLEQCNDSQQKIIYQELNIAFPESTVIDKIIYYMAWGNDTPRTYSMEIHMDADDYSEFSSQFSDSIDMSDGHYKAIKNMTQDDKLCYIKITYITERYTPFESWMKENGEENIGYKRIIAALLFLCLILVSLLPMIPYRKIVKLLNPL